MPQRKPALVNPHPPRLSEDTMDSLLRIHRQEIANAVAKEREQCALLVESVYPDAAKRIRTYSRED